MPCPLPCLALPSKPSAGTRCNARDGLVHGSPCDAAGHDRQPLHAQVLLRLFPLTSSGDDMLPFPQVLYISLSALSRLSTSCNATIHGPAADLLEHVHGNSPGCRSLDAMKFFALRQHIHRWEWVRPSATTIYFPWGVSFIARICRIHLSSKGISPCTMCGGRLVCWMAICLWSII